jgi:ParB family chromosome partitioning protein
MQGYSFTTGNATTTLIDRSDSSGVHLDVDIPIDIPDCEVKAASTGLNVRPQIELVDTARIRTPAGHNRSSTAFHDQDFFKLVFSINMSGGNVVPVLLHKAELDAEGTEYVLGYGERRYRACRRLGIPVRAIVVGETCTDRMAMLRENLHRADLSPFDLGRQVLHIQAVDPGRSASSIAQEIGTSKSRISDAIRLANLEPSVLAVIPNPCELQYRDAKVLSDAISRNRSWVEEEVRSIRAADANMTTRDVVARLRQISKPNVRQSNASRSIELQYMGQVFGKLVTTRAGWMKVELDEAPSEDLIKSLAKALEGSYVTHKLEARPQVDVVTQ